MSSENTHRPAPALQGEAALLRAMGIEVRRYLERKGVAPAGEPPGAHVDEP